MHTYQDQPIAKSQARLHEVASSEEQKERCKEIQLEKQDGKMNVADLGTKIQTGPTIVNVMGRLGFGFERSPLHGALNV